MEESVDHVGMPNILMQSAYTFYILGLNLILSEFSDAAVTALGLYYKWQTFFFIPLGAMQTCIVPVVSFNYAARNINRCKKTLSAAVGFGMALMALGALCFNCIPTQMLRVFTSDEAVIAIGSVGLDSNGVLHPQPLLISYNPAYDPIKVSPQAMFRIVGQVLN